MGPDIELYVITVKPDKNNWLTRKYAAKEAQENEKRNLAAASAVAEQRAREEEEYARAESARNKMTKQKDILDDFSDADFAIPTAGLSEQKMRDYGYGVPQWSPYRMTKVTSTPEWKGKLWSTTNSEWGSYSKIKSALDPKTQTRLAKGLVKEMKANACMDHTWEIMGERPGQGGDDGKQPKFFMP